ncbi:hypothetical protein D3C86_1145170 [compost metagenome]
MNDDLDGVLPMFDGEELLDGLVLFGTRLVGVDGDDAPRVLPGVEAGALDQRLQGLGVNGVARDDQHEGLDDPLVVLPGVGFQLDLGLLVEADAVL